MRDGSWSPSVLVVDDNQDICETLALLLQNAGYETILAAHGRQALALLRGGLRPCAILLDLTMPVMDGWEFRSEQLRDPRLKEIPVVVMAAASLRSEVITSRLSGVDFVQKPPNFDDILAAVARAQARATRST